MTGFQEWLEKRAGAAATETHQDAQAALDRLVGALVRSSNGALPPLGPGYAYFREWLSASAGLLLPAVTGNRDAAAVAVLKTPHREIVYLVRRYGVQPGQMIKSAWGDAGAGGWAGPGSGPAATWRVPRAGHYPAQTIRLDQAGHEALRELAVYFNGEPLKDTDLILRQDKGSPFPRKLHQMSFTLRLARKHGALPPSRGRGGKRP